MPQMVAASASRWSAAPSLSASFSYFLNSAETCRWSSVSRSTASASFIVRGAVFSAVFSCLGGFGAARIEVAAGLARGAAFVRFIAGEAEAFFAAPLPDLPVPLALFALVALVAVLPLFVPFVLFAPFARFDFA